MTENLSQFQVNDIMQSDTNLPLLTNQDMKGSSILNMSIPNDFLESDQMQNSKEDAKAQSE